MPLTRPAPRIVANGILYIAACALPWSGAAAAEDRSLFATWDQNPFIQVHYLPGAQQLPALGRGQWHAQVGYDLASNASDETRPSGDRLVLDGESHRTHLELSHGLGERLSLTLAVPFVAHTGGFLDGFIQEWHSLLGLSNRRRKAFDDDELAFAFLPAEGPGFAVAERSRGIGDLRLSADWRLRPATAESRSLSLRGGIKLPTGDSATLLGSGSTDFSLQVLSTDEVTLSRWGMTLGWMLGGLWLGPGEVLDDLRRDLVVFGSAGVSRPVSRRLGVRLQFDAHTPFYDSRLRALGSSSVQASIGGSLDLAHGRLDLALTENLFTDTTPDVGLHLAWRTRLGARR